MSYEKQDKKVSLQHIYFTPHLYFKFIPLAIKSLHD